MPSLRLRRITPSRATLVVAGISSIQASFSWAAGTSTPDCGGRRYRATGLLPALDQPLVTASCKRPLTRFDREVARWKNASSWPRLHRMDLPENAGRRKRTLQ